MKFNEIIKKIGCGKIRAKSLDENTAYELYSNILNMKVPELELGSLLIALRVKTESQEEIIGFYRAMQENVIKLIPPKNKLLPIVIPSYNGARKKPNFTPLLALLLSRIGFPVLVHCIDIDPYRITSKDIFYTLGIVETKDKYSAQKKLNNNELVFILVNNFCPPIAKQLALRWRLGLRNSAHTLIKLATPFNEENFCLRLSSVSHRDYAIKITKFLTQIGSISLLIKGTEGEVYAHEKTYTSIKFIDKKSIYPEFCFKKQNVMNSTEISKEAYSTAQWIQNILDKKIPVPYALRLQIACCIIASKKEKNLESAFNMLDSTGY